jgi:hypothetical protein
MRAALHPSCNSATCTRSLLRRVSPQLALLLRSGGGRFSDQSYRRQLLLETDLMAIDAIRKQTSAGTQSATVRSLPSRPLCGMHLLVHSWVFSEEAADAGG